jgi:AAA+ superfamily predicted ATPase
MRLQRALSAGHACVHVVTTEEAHAIETINASIPGRIVWVWHWSVTRGLYPGMIEDSRGVDETEHPAAALTYLTQHVQEPTVAVFADLADHLEDARTRRALRDAIHHLRRHKGTLVLVEPDHQLPAVIQPDVTRIELELPDERELHRLVRNTLKREHQRRPIDVDITKSQLDAIVRNLAGLTRTQAEQMIVDAICEDRLLDAKDINAMLAEKRRRMEGDGVLEYVEAPVDLSEIGGLKSLKDWLSTRRNAISRKAEAFGLSAPRGVLMLGVQGAGKSLCAKAIATAWRRPLLRLDPGALYDRYIGESERRLREALRQAERMAPIILWIDEIEKGFASAAANSNDGGLSQRMFGNLLTWMQEHRAPVFLVATANRIEALPPELLRKGRFDEIFFVDLPTPEVRREILAIHLRKRNRDPERFDLDALVEASDRFSGAELEQAVLSGLHAAFAEDRELKMEDVRDALLESPPLSVTMAERVERLREWARTRCVPAD